MNPLTLLQLLGPIIRNMPRSEAKRLIHSLKGEGLHSGSAYRMQALGKNPKKAFEKAGESARRSDEIIELFEEMGGDVNFEDMENVRDIMINVMNKRQGKIF